MRFSEQLLVALLNTQSREVAQQIFPKYFQIVHINPQSVRVDPCIFSTNVR